MPILVKETIDKFGYDPSSLKPMSGKRIVVSCDCGKVRDICMSDYSRSDHKKCINCSLVMAHANPNSGYHTKEYLEQKSKNTIISNKNRKKNLRSYQQYLPFIEQVKDGKISFVEVSNALGLDDSTVCRWFHSNLGLKSKKHGSLQEETVLENLKKLYPDRQVEVQKRYGTEKRHRADFFINGVGYIEYDGNGFFHQLKKSDDFVDLAYKPIRLSAQAVFGGIDYLAWKIKNENNGYCAVSSPKEYQVKLVGNRKQSTKMLENCHPLGNCAGSDVIGLYYKDLLIGVAKFGLPTNRADVGLTELRRFFVLDGTPKNTESYFLRQCEILLKKDLVTYVHHDERGSYLKALGWEQIERPKKDYDYYLIDGKMINKRRMFGWAQKTGLVKKFGTTNAKEILCKIMGGEKVFQPSKIKFTKKYK